MSDRERQEDTRRAQCFAVLVFALVNGAMGWHGWQLVVGGLSFVLGLYLSAFFTRMYERR